MTGRTTRAADNRIMSSRLELSSREAGALADLKGRLAGLLDDRLVDLRVFGSKARGDAEADSDLDVAVIVKGLSRALRRRIYTEAAEVELQWLQPVSLLLFSEEDFARLRGRERRIALDIEREGISF